jgi:hypothetical protein
MTIASNVFSINIILYDWSKNNHPALQTPPPKEGNPHLDVKIRSVILSLLKGALFL